MTGHSFVILNAVDRLTWYIIDGQEITPEVRERLECAKAGLEMVLDGRIAEGTDHMDAWANISRAGWEKAYGKTA